MKIFNDNFTTTIYVQDVEWFKNRLDRIILNPRGKFVGIHENGEFRLRRRYSHFNSFRPEVTGKFYGNDVTLEIGVNRTIMIMVAITYLVMIILFWGNLFPMIFTMILWTLLWYLSGSYMYSKEYHQTKTDILKIFENTAPKASQKM